MINASHEHISGSFLPQIISDVTYSDIISILSGKGCFYLAIPVKSTFLKIILYYFKLSKCFISVLLHVQINYCLLDKLFWNILSNCESSNQDKSTIFCASFVNLYIMFIEFFFPSTQILIKQAEKSLKSCLNLFFSSIHCFLFLFVR